MINLNINWGNALLVAVLGLATVFAVLIIIMLAIVVMSKIFAPKTEKPKKEQAPSNVQAPAPKVTQAVQKTTDDTELIAVIAAAIAATLNTSVNNIKIKSYKRLGTSNSAWANASRRENIYKL